MTNKETAFIIAEELDTRKAIDITIIDISEKSGFADYFVIASAGSLRMLSSLPSLIEDRLAKEGIFADHIEGKGDCGWILMDYKDIIVNLFTIEQREHYKLEKVWADCARIDYEGKNQ